MLLVGYAAIGCAALRYSTDLWASGLFTFAVLLQMIAMLAVALRNGASRAVWIGFLVFGGGYLLLACGPWQQADLITSKGLTWLQQRAQGELVDAVALTTTAPGSVGYVGGTFVNTTTLNTSQLLLWDARMGSSSTFMQSPFLRIGHSLLSPLIGLLGAMSAAWFYAGRKTTKDGHITSHPTPLVENMP